MNLIQRKLFLLQLKHSFLLLNRLHILLVFCLLATALSVSAQSRRAYERAGDKAMANKDFGAAMQHYGVALERRPTDHAVIWKYAECARNLHAYPLAEKMYRELLGTEKHEKNWPELEFRLAEVLKNQGNYAVAIAMFEQFRQGGGAAANDLADRVAVELAACRWALQNQQDTTGVTVQNAGNKINSPYSDFAPFILGDTLFFSSYRFNKRGDRSIPRVKLTKVMFSKNGGRARELSRGFPDTDTAHVAHTAFTADGHFLFLTLCKNKNASEIQCDLWLAVKDLRNRWGTPVRLPEPVNAPGYTTTHPFVAYDSLSEQLNLWFASDRPGGKGGLDIWQMPLDTNWFCPCNVPIDSRKPFWSPRFEAPPVNLESINTAGNEATPFYHVPDRSLYFSSDYRPGFGGYDIFRATADSAVFSTPKNAGPGLNSSYNDLYFILRPDGKSGYLSSNRPGSQYLDEANKACCNDIFQVQYPVPPPPEAPLAATPLTPRRPVERPMIPIEQLQEPKPEPPPVLADFVGLPLYFDNDEPDKRTRRIKTRKNYEETVRPYLERQAEYRERFAEGLTGAQRERAEDQVDHFFENEVRQGFERLDQLCSLLLQRLDSGEEVEVIIKGFTSPRAESDYNLALGRRRISSVRNYFETYAESVLKPFVEAGKLRISEASFGETTVRSGVSDNLEDERNSVYHPDAARERRVELVEIRKMQ